MDITSINHVGMAVRDMAATAARYEAMGFQLTPYSPHSGAWTPGAAVAPLASGNRCVMFADTYLEILASENPDRPAERITTFLKRHQGGHIICFDSPDCHTVDRRLKAAGVATSDVIPLQRDIDTPEGVRTARFERVQFAPKDTPEGYIQAARHLTPDYVYQPRYCVHPNGCYRLSETIVVAVDPTEMIRRYTTYTGSQPTVSGGSARFVQPMGTALSIVDWRHVRDLLPGTLLAPAPSIAAVVFKARDLGAVRRLLGRAGIPVVTAGDRLLVPAEEACGLAVLFEA